MKKAMPSAAERISAPYIWRVLSCADGTTSMQDADALVAAPEEQLADDGADHRQAGGDAEAGEDRRHRGGELQLPQPGPRDDAVRA